MKHAALLLASLLSCSATWACPVCRPKVEAGIHNPAYLAHVLLVLLPVAVLLVPGLALSYWDKLTVRFARPHASFP